MDRAAAWLDSDVGKQPAMLGMTCRRRSCPTHAGHNVRHSCLPNGVQPKRKPRAWRGLKVHGGRSREPMLREEQHQ